MKYFFTFLWILFLGTTLYSEVFEKKYEIQSHAVVFMYHHFGKSKYPSTNIRLEQFEAQLDYLKKNNYKVWPLSKIIRYVKNKNTLPPKTVAITIDDAYISIYTHAYPMLKKRNFPFSVFVNTNPIGHNSVNYMTWEHMREMKLYGAEFANHSSTHDYLVPKKTESKEQWQGRIKKEIEDAQNTLQEELGYTTNVSPKIISYPFGEYTKESANYIQSLGYIGVSQTSGVVSETSDLRNIPRFAMSEKFANIEDFILKLNTLPFPLISAEPWNPIVRSNPPKLKIELDRVLKDVGCYTSNGKAINMQWISQREFEVQASTVLEGSRDRYTCTAVDKNGRWYWYSHLWIIKR